MPQSLSRVIVHAIFSTKDRAPTLTPDVREDLYSYLGGILREIGCTPIQNGGHNDHVHLLFGLSRTVTISQTIQALKTGSTPFLKERLRTDFAWQSGFGIYSVSESDIGRVVAYIQNQEEHHRKVTFQDELRALLSEANVDFDEAHIWT